MRLRNLFELDHNLIRLKPALISPSRLPAVNFHMSDQRAISTQHPLTTTPVFSTPHNPLAMLRLP